MRKQSITGMFLVLGVALASTTAIADHPGSDWLPMEKALSILKKDGYSQITEIEAEHGRWEGKGIKKGYMQEFKINPHNGDIASTHDDYPGPDWISMDKVIAILKKDGYSRISEIEADDGHWEGEGTKKGQTYEFHIDPHSGKFTKNKPDD